MGRGSVAVFLAEAARDWAHLSRASRTKARPTSGSLAAGRVGVWAFYGNQFGNTFPLFARYGVPLWVPEVGGPIDPDNQAHDLIMSVFGGVSKGERNRIKI